MAAYQLLRCSVALGGDRGNVVVRDRTRPIVFPELPILQQMHGEDAVDDVHVVGKWDSTNEEVLLRLHQIYGTDIVREVFPGARPRLPVSDPSIPRCTLPVYRPRPTLPDSPDPKLKPLDQFTMGDDVEIIEVPPLAPESDPTPDEIAAHRQDDEAPDEDLVPDDDPTMPRPADLPRGLPTRTRGTQSRPTPSTLPDVAAGGSHSPAAPR